ncbi:hypothetical protein GCM10023313_11430 [Mucilaginibacter defluvii]|uniref:Conjugal transfer protein TraI n=2 Tax=Mucilaginibacter defluvii TaxID=1196019 RepID=A0ABP9FR96_9SPHI
MLLAGALFCLASLIPPKAQAQIPIVDLIKGAIKKVIVAIDINVQRLQNKTIALQNAAQQVENTLHLNSLNGINDWLNKEKDLYKGYYEELSRVRKLIAGYQAIRSIIGQQAQIVSEYRRASALFKSDRHFRPEELRYMDNIYSGILEESMRNLDGLVVTISDLASQMNDSDRITRIAETARAMQTNLDHLRRFNQQNAQLSLARSLDGRDRAGVKKMYNIR